MFGSFLPPVVVSNTRVVLCSCLGFPRLVYPMLPVSLDCQFWIAPSVFANVYQLHVFVYMYACPLRLFLLL